jgi:hypothetical protein
MQFIVDGGLLRFFSSDTTVRFTLGVAVCLSSAACAPQSSGSGNPLADRELVEASQIYLGSDQLALVAQPTSQDSEGDTKPNDIQSDATKASQGSTPGSSPEDKRLSRNQNRSQRR